MKKAARYTILDKFRSYVNNEKQNSKQKPENKLQCVPRNVCVPFVFLKHVYMVLVFPRLSQTKIHTSTELIQGVSAVFGLVLTRYVRNQKLSRATFPLALVCLIIRYKAIFAVKINRHIFLWSRNKV